MSETTMVWDGKQGKAVEMTREEAGLPSVAEEAALKAARREAKVDKALDVDDVHKLMFRIMLEQENRIRNLEGRRSITAKQFRAWVKSQL